MSPGLMNTEMMTGIFFWRSDCRLRSMRDRCYPGGCIAAILKNHHRAGNFGSYWAGT